MKKQIKSYMKIYNHAKDIPDEWNLFCKENFHMNRNILEFLETVNDCKQKYYMIYNDDKQIEACFVMFPFQYEFSNKIKLNVQLIFLPVSVADSGIVAKNNSKALAECLKKIKGIKLILSTPEGFELKDGIKYKGLPNCMMDIKWNTVEEYFNSMKSRYRKKMKQIIKNRKNLTVRILEDNTKFTDEMHELYIQVMNHAGYVLEVLNIDFFRNSFAKTLLIEKENEPKAFVQFIEENEKIIGEFCGFDYKDRDEYNLYDNVILALIEYAINHKIKLIDIGQSAEGTKLKFGAYLENKYSWIFYNGNKFLNAMLKFILLHENNERRKYDYKVFKENG